MDIPRELARLIRDSPNLRGLLDTAVTLIAERMGVDVCSVYLLDPADSRLWLVASHGFRSEAVGAVSMGWGEGLTGEVVSRLRRVVVPDADRDPRYHHFPETGEEGFQSYLGEPLALGRRPVGSIVLRTRNRREFTEEERDTLSAIASQLVGLVENARLVEALGEPTDSGRAYWREIEKWYGPRAAAEPSGAPALLEGQGLSTGIALGDAFVASSPAPPPTEDSGPFDSAVEGDRLERAIVRAREELEAVQEFTRREAGEDTALIFGSHLLFLSDHGLRRRLESLIAEGESADRAVVETLADVAAQLEAVPDPYIRERSGDVLDLRDRLLDALRGSDHPDPSLRDRIAVIPSLTASAAVELRAREVAGIVAEHGAPTSHGAILARSFGVPVVAGVPGALQLITDGDRVGLDAAEGVVLVRPEAEVESSIRSAMIAEQAAAEQREHLRDREAVTRDGRRVQLLANVGFGADIRMATRHGAEGVGLYRTELPFLVRDAIPSRAEQVRLYRPVFEAFPDLPVVCRTLDLGGDKFLRAGGPPEANPFLGHRSIRLSLDHPEEFVTQIQAFQIAAHGHDGRILLPLVSRVSEVRRAREYVQQASDRLREEGIEHHSTMPLGVMIEVPAAVEIAARLAREVSFFSIGTNDLAQYALAVDRGNERVAHLGDPCHPAVLSLIRRTVLAGREAGVTVSVCGEMAGNPATALLLLGLGVERLSMNPAAIPLVKEAILESDYGELRDRARGLVDLDGPDEVRTAWPPFAARSAASRPSWIS